MLAAAALPTTAMKHDDQPPRRGAGANPWDNARPRSTGQRPDKRERERLKAAGAGAGAGAEPLRRYSPALGGSQAPPRGSVPSAAAPPRPEIQQRHEELRLFGINACRAAFAQRPQELRKVYLVEERIAQFKPLLAWCVQQRLGYRVVEAADLAKLTASQHHEGICLEMRRQQPLALAQLLAQLPPAPAPALLALLDGVGNPHNFGAVLRSAANFGLDGLLLPADSTLSLSGAACRVAEGGAEFVPLARPQPGEDLLAALRAAGFTIAATVPRDGTPLYQAALPARLALVFGAESEGMSSALIAAADLRLTIPGSGKVESLNIAASAAVLFAEHYRRHRP
jgi:RNA methyltransferase, TrmH family